MLHLGIPLDSYKPPEEILAERLDEEATVDMSAPVELPPDRIPETFTSLDSWPTSTGLRCWSCNFTFDGRPKFVPTFLREGNKKIEAGVEGNFCTFNCAARHIDDFHPPQIDAETFWQMRDNLCHIYFIFTGTRVSHILPADRRTELKEYGGKYTPEEFWERLRELDPANGLKDHRLGSILPERMRQTVWDVCGAESHDGPLDAECLDAFPLLEASCDAHGLEHVSGGAESEASCDAHGFEDVSGGASDDELDRLIEDLDLA
jgi:hypothetical protein